MAFGMAVAGAAEPDTNLSRSCRLGVRQPLSKVIYHVSLGVADLCDVEEFRWIDNL